MASREGIPATLHAIEKRSKAALDIFTPRSRRLQWMKFVVAADKARINEPFVVSNADVVWLRDASSTLVRICASGVDVAALHNDVHGNANAGFILSCGTWRAKVFWQGLVTRLGFDTSQLRDEDATHRVIAALPHRVLNRTRASRLEKPLNDQLVRCPLIEHGISFYCRSFPARRRPLCIRLTAMAGVQ
jgi:hypothetical protein